MIPCWVRIAYALVALTASALYGWYAVKIFLGVPSKDEQKHFAHRDRLSWRNHQRWFNFCGSLVGWICLWFLGLKFVPVAVTDSYPSLKWGDIGLAFVAFVGVTGYLPGAVVTVVNTGMTVIGKITGGGGEK
jgi:hypothetical protein